MPSTYAHYSFGRKVLKTLSNKNKEIIEKNIQLFDIGVHGPDILFYYKAYKKNRVNTLGNKMHKESAYTFFNKNKDLIDKSPKHEAYLYGFLCHFALDQACHGYVSEIEKLGYEHTKIESEFEKYLMLNDGIKKPQAQKLTNHIHPSEENAEVIKDFFQGLSKEDIYTSLKSMVLYHDILRSPGIIKRGILNLAFSLMRNESFRGLLISHGDNKEFNVYSENLYTKYKLGLKNCNMLIENFRYNKDGIKNFDDLYYYDFGSNWRGK